MPKAAFHTLGCKLNFSETSVIGEDFQKNGFHIVDFNDRADVYVINTCTVTDHADRECRQVVRRALRANPDAFVIVTGCYAQLKPREIADIEGVDAVLGSNEKFKIFEIFDDFDKKELSCIYISPRENLDDFYPAYSTGADKRTRAFLKIQDGCDYKCSFCTIPLARGLSRSGDPETVIGQFTKLVESGYKEIVITGVNVGDYRHGDIDFYRLLRKLVSVDGEFRIRISSIEPNLVSDGILDLLASESKLCNHLHIPLQSGSSKILKLMRRRYDKDHYRELIHRAHAKIEGLGIGIDVIVGFPGETDEDFYDSYEFLKELPFSYLHVFTYSERKNTHSLSLPDPVKIEERKRRNNMLRILSAKKRNLFYREMVGNRLEVLFEGEDSDGFMKGFASNYTRVKMKFDHKLVNKFSPVAISAADNEICTGDIINQDILNSLAG